ncbi:MAG TPA: hypothetical protein ENH99_00970 [Candidatus Pacearchaeota archaeon]|nr:hypothetical protein [Candidatus Pacearchaeota archaeon]
MKKKEHKKQGKKNRAAGTRFELKVRKDLEDKGWVVSKWMNNVEFMSLDQINKKELKLDWKPNKCENSDSPVLGRLVPAKHRFRGPGIPMSIGTGFPDFIAFQNHTNEKKEAVFGIINACDPLEADSKLRLSSIIGVESKSNGNLDKIEREKCAWLLNNNIFTKILIAQKGEKRGEIIYKEFSQ